MSGATRTHAFDRRRRVAHARWLAGAALVACQSLSSAGAAAPNRGGAPTGPFLTIGYTVSDEADFDGGAGRTLALKETRIVAGVLPADSSARRVDAGLDYQYTRYVYEFVDSRNRDLHRLQLPIGLRAPAGKWRLDAFVAPGIATSSNVMKDPFDRASSDDFFATARAEATRGTGAPLRWLLGLAWDRSFGEARVYPVAGIDYQPSARLHARIAFPDPTVRLTTGARQTWRFRLYPAGFEWHVLDDDLVTEFDYRVEAWRAEAWWSLRAWRDVFVDLSVGYEFDRRHELTDRVGARIERDVDDAILFTIGFRWRGGTPAPTHQVARAYSP